MIDSEKALLLHLDEVSNSAGEFPPETISDETVVAFRALLNSNYVEKVTCQIFRITSAGKIMLQVQKELDEQCAQNANNDRKTYRRNILTSIITSAISSVITVIVTNLIH